MASRLDGPNSGWRQELWMKPTSAEHKSLAAGPQADVAGNVEEADSRPFQRGVEPDIPGVEVDPAGKAEVQIDQRQVVGRQGQVQFADDRDDDRLRGR